MKRGDPPSKFEWFKGDTNIANITAGNPPFSITQYTNRISYLTVTGVSSELAGTYKCATNNGIGKNQATAHIRVECKYIYVHYYCICTLLYLINVCM